MHEKCRLCWGVPVVGGGLWWVGGKPNLVISDELINTKIFHSWLEDFMVV